MKTRSIFLLSIVFILCSCGSSRSVSKDRITISSFDKIIANAEINIYFSKSNSNYVEIESGSNVAVDVRNGTLMFSRKRGGKSDVYVYGNNIESVILSGASNFYADKLNSNRPLSIATSGRSSVQIDKLSANNFNLALSGKSSFRVNQLKGKNLNVATSGASHANIGINKTDNTNIAVSGGSDVSVKGKTRNVSINVSGGANVNIRDLKYNHSNVRESGGGKVYK